MIIGESENFLGNFMGICFWGLRFGIFFIWLFYTWVSLICLVHYGPLVVYHFLLLGKRRV